VLGFDFRSECGTIRTRCIFSAVSVVVVEDEKEGEAVDFFYAPVSRTERRAVSRR
jgi:hypothetical protein